MICDHCHAGKHFRCGGRCACALCPIDLRKYRGLLPARRDVQRKEVRPSTSSPARAPRRRSIPEPMRRAILDAYRLDGLPLSVIARKAGVPRHRVRYLVESS